MSLHETLGEIFGDVFGYKDELSCDLGPSSVAGWDSIAQIAMVEALESHFDIRLTTDEMIEMTDVGAISEVLARHGVQE